MGVEDVSSVFVHACVSRVATYVRACVCVWRVSACVRAEGVEK